MTGTPRTVDVVHARTIAPHGDRLAYQVLADWFDAQPDPKLAVSALPLNHLYDQADYLPVGRFRVRGLRRAGWEGEPLLLLYPTMSQLAEITRFGAVMGAQVGLLEFLRPAHQGAWLTAHRATDLLTGNQHTGDLLDAAGEQILERLRQQAGWGTGWELTSRQQIRDTIAELDATEQQLLPERIWAWALVHGASVASARRLHRAALRAVYAQLLWTNRPYYPFAPEP